LADARSVFTNGFARRGPPSWSAPSHQFLAGPRLAQDQHVALPLRRALEHLQDVAQPEALPDHARREAGRVGADQAGRLRDRQLRDACDRLLEPARLVEPALALERVHALVVAAARLHDAGEALAQPQPDRPRVLRLGLAEDAVRGEARLRQREPLLEGERARIRGEQQELGVGEGAARLAEQEQSVLGAAADALEVEVGGDHVERLPALHEIAEAVERRRGLRLHARAEGRRDLALEPVERAAAVVAVEDPQRLGHGASRVGAARVGELDGESHERDRLVDHRRARRAAPEGRQKVANEEEAEPRPAALAGREALVEQALQRRSEAGVACGGGVAAAVHAPQPARFAADRTRAFRDVDQDVVLERELDAAVDRGRARERGEARHERPLAGRAAQRVLQELVDDELDQPALAAREPCRGGVVAADLQREVAQLPDLAVDAGVAPLRRQVGDLDLREVAPHAFEQRRELDRLGRGRRRVAGRVLPLPREGVEELQEAEAAAVAVDQDAQPLAHARRHLGHAAELALDLAQPDVVGEDVVAEPVRQSGGDRDPVLGLLLRRLDVAAGAALLRLAHGGREAVAQRDREPREEQERRGECQAAQGRVAQELALPLRHPVAPRQRLLDVVHAHEQVLAHVPLRLAQHVERVDRACDRRLGAGPRDGRRLAPARARLEEAVVQPVELLLELLLRLADRARRGRRAEAVEEARDGVLGGAQPVGHLGEGGARGVAGRGSSRCGGCGGAGRGDLDRVQRGGDVAARGVDRRGDPARLLFGAVREAARIVTQDDGVQRGEPGQQLEREPPPRRSPRLRAAPEEQRRDVDERERRVERRERPAAHSHREPEQRQVEERQQAARTPRARRHADPHRREQHEERDLERVGRRERGEVGGVERRGVARAREAAQPLDAEQEEGDEADEEQRAGATERGWAGGGGGRVHRAGPRRALRSQPDRAPSPGGGARRRSGRDVPRWPSSYSCCSSGTSSRCAARAKRRAPYWRKYSSRVPQSTKRRRSERSAAASRATRCTGSKASQRAKTSRSNSQVRGSNGSAKRPGAAGSGE
jgi:hypothetical protein